LALIIHEKALLVCPFLDILPHMIALAIILFSSYALILAWLASGMKRAKSAASSSTALPDVSVIVAARDEAATLPACLHALASQTYAGKMQVLIVDDQSRDDTKQIAQEAARGRDNWLVLENTHPARWRSRKKGALATALAHAAGEVLLFTDADCTPPPDWAAHMVRCFSPGTALVAGYSPLQTPASSLLWQAFIRVDTLASALVAAGSIGHGHGITATGRNLACKRQMLLDQAGYAQFPDSISGDDDFLLQRTRVRHAPATVKYAWHSGAMVPARGPADWRAFMRQKTRHLSAGRYYPLAAQALYGMAHLSHVSLLLFFFTGFISPSAAALFFPAKLMLDALLLGCLGRQLQTPINLPGLLLWELLFPVYQAAAWLRGLTKRPGWKETA